MRIGLCMEKPEELEHIQFVIEEYLKIRSCCYEMETFCGLETMSAALKERKLDLLFLEAEEKQKEKAAAILQDKREETKLVCLVRGQAGQEAVLGKLPFAVVNESRIAEKLPELMDRFLWKEHFLKRERLLLNTKGKQVVIPIKELMYLERDKRITTLALSDGSVEISAQELSVLQDTIGRDDFLRCHNSYVINLNFVKEFRRNEFCLFNGKDIPISRRYLDEVRRRFKIWADSIW